MFIKPNTSFGVGINYRSEIATDLVRHLDHFDFIEINTERLFVDRNNQAINHILKEKPIVLHGLTLSIGTLHQDISPTYLSNLKKVLKNINCLWFSEHVAMTNVNGLEIRSLMPVEFTRESVEQIVNKVKIISSISNKPFLLENITYYYTMPNNNMSELSFINQIASRADCGILLDLNNLYVNAFNHMYDPYEFIDRLPLDRIVEVHLAGCDYIHGMLIDSHASSVRKDVLTLFEHLCKKTTINGVVIERDAKLEHFSDLLTEVQEVRDIMRKCHVC